MIRRMENFWRGVCLYVASVLTLFFGALTLGAILSWLSAGDARLLLFAVPQFVANGLCAWALFRDLTSSAS